MSQICFRSCLLLITMILCSSCSIFYFGDSSIYSPPPRLLDVAPKLLEIRANPEHLVPGRNNRVTIVVKFEDLNKNVGPGEAKILRTVSKVSGDFSMTPNVRTLTEPITLDGIKGELQSAFNISVPRRVAGILKVEIMIYDNTGLASDPISVELQFP